jgi:hypothetical protein
MRVGTNGDDGLFEVSTAASAPEEILGFQRRLEARAMNFSWSTIRRRQCPRLVGLDGRNVLHGGIIRGIVYGVRPFAHRAAVNDSLVFDEPTDSTLMRLVTAGGTFHGRTKGEVKGVTERKNTGAAAARRHR